MNNVKNSSMKNDDKNETNKIIIETDMKLENAIVKEKETQKMEVAKKGSKKESVMEMEMEMEMEKDEELVLERFEFPLGSVIATVEMMFVAEEEYLTQTRGDIAYLLFVCMTQHIRNQYARASC